MHDNNGCWLVTSLIVARIEDRGRRDSYKINITADSVTLIHVAGGAIKQTKQQLVARRGPPFGFGRSTCVGAAIPEYELLQRSHYKHRSLVKWS